MDSKETLAKFLHWIHCHRAEKHGKFKKGKCTLEIGECFTGTWFVYLLECECGCTSKRPRHSQLSFTSLCKCEDCSTIDTIWRKTSSTSADVPICQEIVARGFEFCGWEEGSAGATDYKTECPLGNCVQFLKNFKRKRPEDALFN